MEELPHSSVILFNCARLADWINQLIQDPISDLRVTVDSSYCMGNVRSRSFRYAASEIIRENSGITSSDLYEGTITTT